MGIIAGNDVQYVHPTFLYESLADFVIFIYLIKLSKNRKYSGQIMYWYLILYSYARFWIEGLRADSLMIGGFRVSQVVSLIIFIIITLFYKKLKMYCESKCY